MMMKFFMQDRKLFLFSAPRVLFVCFSILVFELSSFILTAQDTAVIIPMDSVALIPNLIDSTMVMNDSIANFCGCESVESVRRCEECFMKSGSVLKTGYEMSFKTNTVVKGSCWGFVNAVYTNAGVVKETIFSSKQGGRYAGVEMLKPGDWIYHVNYSFRNVGHSAIFVCWKDKSKKQAITLSYVGMSRPVPGRLDIADLSGVYSIFREKR
jgi:hypothetical protein